MKHEDFQKMCKALRALGCHTNNNPECLAVVKIAEFVKDFSKFESNCKEIIQFYDSNPLESEKVIMNKSGAIFLVKSWQIGKDENGNIAWTGAKVTANEGQEVLLPMNDIVPYTKAAKTLYGVKNDI